MFCVKSLQSCIGILSNSQHVPKGYKDLIKCLLERLPKCVGSNDQLPQFCVEKALFHIARQYGIKKCYIEQLAVIQLLQSLLVPHKGDSTATQLHRAICSQMQIVCASLTLPKDKSLFLQLRMTAMSSVFSVGDDETFVMNSMAQFASKLPGSHELISFYGKLELILPLGLGVGNKALFLSRYCRACYNCGNDSKAEDCLKKLSGLTVKDSNTLDGLVLLIRTCHTIDSVITPEVADNTVTRVTDVAAKLAGVKQSHLLPAIAEVMDWLNELLADQALPVVLIDAFHHLESVYLCCTSNPMKKLYIYNFLLGLIFANLKLGGSDVSEQLRCAGEQVAPSDNRLAELALSLLKQAQQECG